jgi:ATP-dependent protease ClpP protease subunit
MTRAKSKSRQTTPTRNEPRVGAADNELLIYGEIGARWYGEGIEAKDVASFCRDYGAGDEIVVRIHSPGGDVFEGVAIAAQLRSCAARKVVKIDGACFSIASVIAMCGDEVRIGESAMMMIHDPWTWCAGNARDLRDVADRLDKIGEAAVAKAYVRKTGMSDDEVLKLMAAETWLSAEEALEQGFVDAIDPLETREAEEETDDENVAALVKKAFAGLKSVPDEARRLAADAISRGRAMASREPLPGMRVAAMATKTPPATERGAPTEPENDMDLKEAQAALDKANQDLGAANARADEQKARAEKAEAENVKLLAANAAHEAQNAALAKQRDEAAEELKTLKTDAAKAAAEAQAKILAAEVDALVGVKIDPAERDTFLELAVSNRALFDKMVNQRAVMTILNADPAGIGPDPKPAPLGAADNGEGLAKRVSARATS